MMDPGADLCSSTQSSDLNAPDHRASQRHPEAREGNLDAIYAPVLQERLKGCGTWGLSSVKHLLQATEAAAQAAASPLLHTRQGTWPSSEVFFFNVII